MDASRGPTDWRALPEHRPDLTIDYDMSLGQQVAAALGAATPDDTSRLAMLRRATARLVRGGSLGTLEYLAVQQAMIVERAAAGRDDTSEGRLRGAAAFGEDRAEADDPREGVAG